ncbi:Acyl-coenzyme A:6-aminopenicillanic acid acyl-transferase [Thermomonospora echinospora]|uniref:Acyl-coenzyme A:6-aminopenicillanic acid acyl-transferase n=1 Tax=Thermomonospora echinospora TaxID=1992 RepID=A0A1H6B0F6_9ACTN|nr:Acyl-coenzyme A:6-aminopenicillanic acid acyl-transferase [Thermomonospora echinospora]
MRVVAAVVVAVALVMGGAALRSSGSREADGSLTADEQRSLATLRVVDARHPLLAMTLYAPYDPLRPVVAAPATERPLACSLFLARRGPRGPVFGRNFDWLGNPALLLTTRPPRGPASISLVDISYLGITHAKASRVTRDPVLRRKLLQAAALPFDGMNEHGLTIGLAQIPDAEPPRVPGRPTVGSARIQRLVLDQARTVDEAIAVFGRYNVEFAPGEPALHYLVADARGRSAVVEFVDGRVKVIRGTGSWQGMVNFVLSGAGEDVKRSDDRYRTIAERMRATGGGLSPAGAMDLLAAVAQRHTRWSAVYELHHGTVHVALGRDYHKRYTFSLKDD